MVAFADFGAILLGYLIKREGVTPVRHAEGSVTFPMTASTISDYVALVQTLREEVEETGIYGYIFWQFALMVICTMGRIDKIVDGTYDIMTMQCYDNPFADVLLEEPEGMFAIVDLFTWPGVIKAYAFMVINSAYETITSSFTFNSIVYFFYLLKMDTIEYGEFELTYPIYEFFNKDTTVLTLWMGLNEFHFKINFLLENKSKVNSVDKSHVFIFVFYIDFIILY